MSLEALERSDLSRLPGGIFTRAFIRAYAQEVGLDPDRTIQDFIAELPPDAATATAHSAAVEDGEKLESDRKAVATALRLVLISLPIIVLVVYYGSHRASASRTAFIRDLGSGSQAAAGEPQPASPVEPVPTAPEPAAAPPVRSADIRDFDGARADGRVLGFGHGRWASGVRAIDERRRQTCRHGREASCHQRRRCRSVRIYAKRPPGKATRCGRKDRPHPHNARERRGVSNTLMDLGLRSPLLDFFERGQAG